MSKRKGPAVMGIREEVPAVRHGAIFAQSVHKLLPIVLHRASMYGKNMVDLLRLARLMRDEAMWRAQAGFASENLNKTYDELQHLYHATSSNERDVEETAILEVISWSATGRQQALNNLHGAIEDVRKMVLLVGLSPKEEVDFQEAVATLR